MWRILGQMKVPFPMTGIIILTLKRGGACTYVPDGNRKMTYDMYVL